MIEASVWTQSTIELLADTQEAARLLMTAIQTVTALGQCKIFITEGKTYARKTQSFLIHWPKIWNAPAEKLMLSANVPAKSEQGICIYPTQNEE